MSRISNIALFAAGVIGIAAVSCRSGVIEMPWEKGTTVNNLYSEYFNVAQAYEDLKNYSKAIEYYEKSMANPDLNRTAYYKMGRCHALNKNYSKAREIYMNLLSLDSENTSLSISLAYLEAMSGNLEEAEKIYAKVIQTNSSDVSIIKNYMSVLIAQEKNEAAYSTFLEYKENFPEDGSISDFENKLKIYIDSLKKEDNTSKEDASSDSKTE